MAISEPSDPPAAFRIEPGFASRRAERAGDARRLLTINKSSSRLKVALYRLWEDTTEPPELRARAGKDRGGEPDVVLGCAGDIPTLETVAAVHWLHENAPELKVRVVNVVDLMTLFPREFHPHGMDETRFVELFTAAKPVVFAFHGYQRAIHEIVHGHVDVDRFHVRGFNEHGNTTTPFDMVVLHGMSRYHLAAEALRRAGKTSGLRPGGSRPHPDLRVRGGDRKGHRLLEGALRGPARDKRLDLDAMNPPAATLTTGFLEDRDREGSRGTDDGA